MEKEVRTFIAIELSDTAKERLSEIQKQLQQLELDVKWIEPENIHLTLRFLGDLTQKQLKSITEAMPQWVTGVPPFSIAITGLGAFPSPQKPKVIWAGVNDNSGEMSRLAEQIEQGINQCGISKADREFSPHITIGRVKELKNISCLTETVPGYAISPALEQTISKVTLFKSTLSAQGSIYKVLTQVDLQ
jgi:2'-5' RNA ligase